MQISDVRNMLLETGLPVFYYQISNPRDAGGLPYIVYFRESSKVYGSDFDNHIERNKYVIEFYSQKKDLKNEQKIQDVLNNHGISYESTETYIKEENMYLIAYYFENVRKI